MKNTAACNIKTNIKNNVHDKIHSLFLISGKALLHYSNSVPWPNVLSLSKAITSKFTGGMKTHRRQQKSVILL